MHPLLLELEAKLALESYFGFDTTKTWEEFLNLCHLWELKG